MVRAKDSRIIASWITLFIFAFQCGIETPCGFSADLSLVTDTTPKAVVDPLTADSESAATSSASSTPTNDLAFLAATEPLSSSTNLDSAIAEPSERDASEIIQDFTATKTLPSWASYTTLSLHTKIEGSIKISLDASTSFAAIPGEGSAQGTDHSFPITGLESGTSYMYYIYLKDSLGKEYAPLPMNIQVAEDHDAPVIKELAPSFIYFDTTTIQWNTTEPADSYIEYGETPDYGMQTELDHAMGIPHAVTLTNLKSGTTYYYRVISKDRTGNTVVSEPQSFSTLSRAYAKEFFVAVDGSDSNAGTIDQPFGTLEQAASAVRVYRNANPNLTAPVMVWIRGGEYFRNQPLYLSGMDSGTIQSPTIFSGYNNEESVITGGQEITGFEKVTDSGILDRLNDSIRDQVYQINLSSLQPPIADYGALFGAPPRGSVPLELFFNGKPMTLAKYPPEGNLTITSVSTEGKVTLGYGTDEAPGNWNMTNADIWVHGWFKYDWRDQRQHVQSIDSVNHTITLDPPNSVEGYGKDQWFYFENVLEGMDTPGEYYLDRKTGILYFLPPANLSTGKATVSMANDNLVRINKSSNIMLRNLTFEYTRGNAIQFSESDHISIVNSVIRNIGAGAVKADKENTSGIYNSVIHDVGTFGISLSDENRGTLTGGRNFAVSNKIYRTGRWIMNQSGSHPINLVGDSGYVSHNEIYEDPYLGVLLSGNNHIAEYNEIYDVMKIANDGGGIYVYGDLNARGTMIKYNYIHDIYGIPGDNFANGIYIDEATPGTTLFGNVLNTISPGRTEDEGGALEIGGGRNTIIENNIVMNTKSGIMLGIWSNIAAKLGILANGLQTRDPYSLYYPEGAGLTTSSGLVPEGTVVARNIFFDVNDMYQNYGTQSWNSYIEFNHNLHNTDPYFVDVANHNFQLEENSPAYALGFIRIPFDAIGLLNISSSPEVSSKSISLDEETTTEVILDATAENLTQLIYTINLPLGDDGKYHTDHGTLEKVTSDANVAKYIYKPNLNFFGEDSFTFEVSNGNSEPASGKIHLVVRSVNDAPMAQSQNVMMTEDTHQVMTLVGTDIDSNLLTYAITTNPSHGTLTCSQENCIYTADPNYHGVDSFTFKVSDGISDSAETIVSLNISGVNDVPVLDPLPSLMAHEGDLISFQVSGHDADGDFLTYEVMPELEGASFDRKTGQFIWRATQSGLYELDFLVKDQSSVSEVVSMAITVEAKEILTPPDSATAEINDSTVISMPSVIASKEEQLALMVHKPNSSKEAVLIFEYARSQDHEDIQEIRINKKGVVRLYGTDNVKKLKGKTKIAYIFTNPSLWKKGKNTLVFRNIKGEALEIKNLEIKFIGEKEGLPLPISVKPVVQQKKHASLKVSKAMAFQRPCQKDANGNYIGNCTNQKMKIKL